MFILFYLRYYNSHPKQANNSHHHQQGDEDTGQDAEHPEQSYDELNAYEYDDEFEINDNQAKLELDEDVTATAPSSAHTYLSSNENIEFRVMDATLSSGSTLGALKNKSLRQIRKLRQGLFTGPKDLLKTGLNKFPGYSYNSTDSTLIQTRVRNEFELKHETTTTSNNENNGTIGAKSGSMVTYDIGKKQVVPNLFRLDAESADEERRDTIMRLATNPLDELETVDSRQTVNSIILKKQTNSNEQDGESNA